MSATSTNPARDPVFLHSLFRTGSTWLFHAFRRLGAGYTCFQEPLHEVTLHARDDRSTLLEGQDRNKMELLRHPQLDQPYFSELHAMPDQCFQQLKDTDIYDRYFSEDSTDAGLGFWRCLIEHAPARPVIQECRSAGRIGLLCRELGGYHAYLWRNPHDQWWSYKVAPYFDTATRFILNADPYPPIIKHLHLLIGFERCDYADFVARTYHIAQQPMTADNSYRAFYTLWLLGLHQAVQHADLLMNSDTLSVSAEERQRCTAAFEQVGITGLQLDDCRTPASRFTDKERRRLGALEDEIHTLWVEANMPAAELEALLRLRADHAPDRHRPESTDPALIVDLGRYRDLLWRQETAVADLCKQHRSEQMAAYEQKQKLAEQHQQEQAAAHEREQQLTHRLSVERELREQLAQQLEAAEARATSLDELLFAIDNSLSWRITAPLRKASAACRRLRNEPLPTWLSPLKVKLRRLAGTGARHLQSVIRRHPRLRDAAFRVLNRIPALQRYLLGLLQPPVASRGEVPVALNARSSQIYRQLLAAAEAHRQRDSSGDTSVDASLSARDKPSSE